MTESMIIRVARAMCDRVNGAGDYDENVAQRASGWNGQARAAIQALLTPTEAMVAAGWEHTGDPCWEKDYIRAWQASITAALSEENPPAA